MSLDVTLTDAETGDELFTANITHILRKVRGFGVDRVAADRRERHSGCLCLKKRD